MISQARVGLSSFFLVYILFRCSRLLRSVHPVLAHLHFMLRLNRKFNNAVQMLLTTVLYNRDGMTSHKKMAVPVLCLSLMHIKNIRYTYHDATDGVSHVPPWRVP